MHGITVGLLSSCAIAAATLGSGDGAWHQGDRRETRYERVGTFENRRIRESSGVAVSRQGGGYLWTHNDSDDGPVLYLTDLDGRDRGTVWLRGAGAVDWEDIAAGPCPGRPGSCLVVGDIGNNLGHREWVDLYVVVEPSTLRGPTDTVDVARHLRVRYPGGPRDTEALAVGRDGTVWLVPKTAAGSIEIFRVRATAFAGDTATAERVGDLGFRPVPILGRVPTGAAISPDGARLVVRTYTELYFFAMDDAGTWIADGSPCWLGFADGQGEAVDFHPEGGVVLTAEGLGLGRGGIGRAWCVDG
jgi:hypothetical protein